MKEEKKKNIIIVLLLLVVIALVTFIVLLLTNTIDIKLSNNTNNGEEVSDKENAVDKNVSDNNDAIDYDAETIAREKMPVAISLANQEKIASVYCGAFDDNDMIIVDTDTDSVKVIMDASSKFKALDELKEHLKNNLSEKLINKYFKTEENSYLEKDGKLYCERAHKGFEWLFVSNENKINEDNPITYTITNKKDNSFDVKIEAKYGLMGTEEKDQIVNISSSIIKENGIWLVDKYEQE